MKIMSCWKPIAHMQSPFLYKNGTPRQPTVCKEALGVITIDKSVFNNPEHSLEGLEEYSHIWIFFIFHKNNNEHTKAKVKPPRLNGRKTGVFSTRSPYRPNNIGLTLAKIEDITGSTLTVSGIDILDGTPIVDLKPYIPQYDCPQRPDVTFPVDSDVTTAKDMTSYSDVTSSVNMTSSLDSDVTTAKDMTSYSDATSSVNMTSSLDSDATTAKDMTSYSDATSSVNVTSSVDSDAISSDHDGLGTDMSENKVSDLCVASTHNFSKEDDELNMENKCDSMLCSEPISLARYHCESSKTSEKSDASNLKPSATSADWVKQPPISQLNVRFTSTAEDQLKLFKPGDTNSTTSKETTLSKNGDENSTTTFNLKLSETRGENSATPSDNYRLHFLKSTQQAREAIISILQEDPRSTYRRTQCTDSLYYFTFDTIHVTCWFDENIAEIVRIKPVKDVQALKKK